MKSRYSAYKLHISKYIIDTTHKSNKDFNINTQEWENSILQFCNDCNFNQLTIIEFIDNKLESYVTFRANITCEESDNSFTEKSKFIKEFNKWYYVDGIFLDNL